MKRMILMTAVVFAFAAALAACGDAGTSSSGKASTGEASTGETSDSESAGQTNTIRIGYQKYGTMNILKALGSLEKRLESEEWTAEWTEFPGGPQLLEAMNVGSIDIGHTGEAPPVFAQAAGAPLVYLAHEPPSPKSEAILVPQDSPVQSVADLKGKKVALNKGSNVHYLLVRLLEESGVSYEDIETVYLPPADARVAFEQGSVDAWVIWDPFFAAVQTAANARILADGEGVVSNHEFYLASRSFAEGYPEIINILLNELNKADEWASSNQKEVAEQLSLQLGIDVPSLELASGRREYGIQPISEDVIAEQQKIADTFAQLGLIPEPIQVNEAVLDQSITEK